MNRRDASKSLLAAAGAGLLPKTYALPDAPRFKLSLAEWSLRDRLRSGELSNLRFPVAAKREFGIGAVEYVSTFFNGKEADAGYLRELRQLAEGEGVANVLIMVDLKGQGGELASSDAKVRTSAAHAHHVWVDAAKALGCHAVRVNARGYGAATYADAKSYFSDGLSQLVHYAKPNGIRVLVENHGGFSSNGRWLAEVMDRVGDDHCGTLPDFGNFLIDKEAGVFYDPLVGLSELMPYAKGVSAKAHQFGADGLETTIDYPRMVNIVKNSGFSGYVGIEWGGTGSAMTPDAGIRATKNLLSRLLPIESIKG